MMLIKELASAVNRLAATKSPTKVVGYLDKTLSSQLSPSARRSLLRSLSKFEEPNLALQEFERIKNELFYSLARADSFAFVQALTSFFPLTGHLLYKHIDRPQDFPKEFNLQDSLGEFYQKLANKIAQLDRLEDWQIFSVMVHVNSTQYGKSFMHGLLRGALKSAAEHNSTRVLRDILQSYYELPRDTTEQHDFIGYDPSAALAGDKRYDFDFGKSELEKDPVMLSDEDLEIAYQAARKAENLESLQLISDFLAKKTPG